MRFTEGRPACDWREMSSAALPIDEVLDALRAALAARASAVLVAPPGAGKTTRVPLALLDQPWAVGGKLILLEPRRLAARAAAERMASTLGEPLGSTIGLRARFDTAVSSRTRIEVVTEGVFTRMILDDPALGGVAGVIFDEYHERSLDADLGLALGLDVQAALRPELRLVVMSATLDGARVASLLDDAPVIRSDGRAYPVETRYVGRDPGSRVEEAVGDAIMTALREQHGSVLAFLPGQSEILRTAERLVARLRPGDGDVVPLYGALDREMQNRAIRRAPGGGRRIVLATSIAESALTIDDVRIVVDSGLARVPRYEPDLGLTRLETVRASRASVDQRRGRAGRTQPGVCYRLWEEAATGALPAFGRPEILDADLSGLVLDLAVAGIREPATLRWLDPPPAPALQEARRLLGSLGALDEDGIPTVAGRAVAAIAAPPRIARMVIEAERRGVGPLGGDVATLLVERGLGGTGADLSDRLLRWRRDRAPRAEAARGLARSFVRQARAGLATAATSPAEAYDELGIGQVLALAFPERIAKSRGRGGAFLLAYGRAASVDETSPLANAAFLAVGEITGRAGASRILLAAPLTLADVTTIAAAEIDTADVVAFDTVRAALAARRVTRLGAIVIAEQPLPTPSTLAAAEILASGIARAGIGRLPWTKALAQWRDRVAFLRLADPASWPDLGDGALAEAIDAWLGPALVGKTGLSDITSDDLGRALHGLLPYDLGRRLDLEAPTHWGAPTGSALAIDYSVEPGPSIAVRVQELFGLAVHPTLARGRVPLTVTLLSPAHRPIQITRDLPGFWRGSWAAVRSEMRGRYPRHPWPEDPTTVAPTTRAKPRGT